MLDASDNAGQPAANRLPERRLDILLAAFFALFWAWAALAAVRGILEHNSDLVNPLLRAADMLKGNWTLSGWMSPPDNFYTLDDALSVVFLSFFGFHFSTLLAQSLATYALLVSGAWLLCRPPGASRLVCIVLLFVFLGFASQDQLSLEMSVNCHVLTIAGVLLCFALVARLVDGAAGKSGAAFWAFFAVISFLCLAGDPFYLYVGLLPIVAAAGLHALCSGRWRTVLRVVVVSLPVVICAKLFVWFLRNHGYLIEGSGPFASLIADVPRIGVNFQTYWGSFWLVLGPGTRQFPWLDAQRAALSWPSWIFLLCRFVGVVAAVVWSLKRLVANLKPGNPDLAFVDTVLLAGVAINSAEYLFSTMPALDVSSNRYLAPAMIYASILAVRLYGEALSRVLAGATSRVRLGALVLLAAAMGLLAPSLVWISRQVPNADEHELADYLASRGLTSGYAGYWQSSIITVLSEGKTHVAAVRLDGFGRLSPTAFLAKAGWYNEPANFVLLDNRDTASQGFDKDAVLKTFGPPIDTAQLGPFEVLVWSGDIQPKLDMAGHFRFPLDLLKQEGVFRFKDVSRNVDGSIEDIQTRPKDQIITYGPYMTLPVGHYHVAFSITVTGAASGDSITFDVATDTGATIVARRELSDGELENLKNSGVVSLGFEASNPTDIFEFRVHKKGSLKVTLAGEVLTRDESGSVPSSGH